jgi:putative endonuclease
MLKLPKKIVGSQGEKIARSYIKKQGMKILEENYRAIKGEIDIIANDGECIVFIEVKTNTRMSEFPPEIRVNRAKQEQIGKIAQMYLMKTQQTDAYCRFDIISVILQPKNKNQPYEINHIKDAFWLQKVI